MLEGDRVATIFGGERGGDLERRERVAGVAFGPVDEMREGVVVDRQPFRTEASIGIGQRPLQQRAERLRFEGLEAEQRGSRQQRAGQGEERVLGGGPDEHHEAFLHVREQGVLLGPAETVHLVEEEDRAAAVLAEPGTGALGDLPDVLDPGADRREGLEGLRGGAGDEAGDGRLAGAGRSPEDHRGEAVTLDEDAERPAGPEEALLAHHLVERPRTQSGRERCSSFQTVTDRGGEEVVGHRPMLRTCATFGRDGQRGAMRRPSSASCASSIAVGALVSGSAPDCVFGNTITSRMLSSPTRIATRRSMPNAKPACGGAP